MFLLWDLISGGGVMLYTQTGQMQDFRSLSESQTQLHGLRLRSMPAHLPQAWQGLGAAHR